MSFGKKAIFVGNVDWMAKFIVSGNGKHLTEIVSNKYLRGLVVDELRKQRRIGLGSQVK